ncbi:hypothetical protein FRZ06_05115 [Anoxybacterium hadale]|uniref:Uncharacterized protein n=1 Tax=Anoxybacterium hadale TaxID=3408580 RepID=A0ACD1A8L3_9FIRM|nr:hypothetical protein FRZ06_05115 [Clostridiales bacterium]
MFSQRKSFLKGKLFYVILVGLFGFGIWLNQAPVDVKVPQEISTDSDYPTSTQGAVNQGNKNDYDILDNIIGKNNITSPGEQNNTETNSDSDSGTPADETKKQGYYLLKEVDGVIKVFYYDEQGKEKLIRTTDIAFSLLSVGDQELFQKGIIKNNEEELNELLQDFES